MKYARIANSIVLEVFTPPEGFTLAECFVPQLVAQFQACPEHVESGWILEADGSFSEPPPIPERELPPVVDSTQSVDPAT